MIQKAHYQCELNAVMLVKECWWTNADQRWKNEADVSKPTI